MLDMVRQDVLPAMSDYTKELTESALEKAKLGDGIDCTFEKENVKSISSLMGCAYKAVKKLEGQ